MNADGARLLADCSSNTMHQIGVKGGSHADGLREHGLLERADAMEAFAGLQEGDIDASFLGVQSLQVVVLRLVGRIPIVDDSDRSGRRETHRIV